VRYVEAYSSPDTDFGGDEEGEPEREHAGDEVDK